MSNDKPNEEVLRRVRNKLKQAGAYVEVMGDKDMYLYPELDTTLRTLLLDSPNAGGVGLGDALVVTDPHQGTIRIAPEDIGRFHELLPEVPFVRDGQPIPDQELPTVLAKAASLSVTRSAKSK